MPAYDISGDEPVQILSNTKAQRAKLEAHAIRADFYKENHRIARIILPATISYRAYRDISGAWFSASGGC